MITKKITYEDFYGNMVTEECQFHLTKSEIMKMELSETGGMYATLDKMVKEKDTPKLVEYFDNFIKASYGKKSDDGKKFIKTKELTDDFISGLAYDELIIELLSNPEEAVSFFKGILPKELASQIDSNAIDEAKKKANIAALDSAGEKPEVSDASNNDSEN